MISRSKLVLLDLFSGKCGWSNPWRERGHEVFTVDWQSRFKPDLCIDISYLTVSKLPYRRGEVDVILASPPCDTFSYANRVPHWQNGVPLSVSAAKAARLVQRTLQLIQYYQPKSWIIENPRGHMSRLKVLESYDLRYITQCQYGMPFQKPTMLVGEFPATLRLRPVCSSGSSCHVRSPRGTDSGMMKAGRTAADRAMIPRELAVDVLEACEQSYC